MNVTSLSNSFPPECRIAHLENNIYLYGDPPCISEVPLVFENLVCEKSKTRNKSKRISKICRESPVYSPINRVNTKISEFLTEWSNGLNVSQYKQYLNKDIQKSWGQGRQTSQEKTGKDREDYRGNEEYSGYEGLCNDYCVKDENAYKNRDSSGKDYGGYKNNQEKMYETENLFNSSEKLSKSYMNTSVDSRNSRKRSCSNSKNDSKRYSQLVCEQNSKNLSKRNTSSNTPEIANAYDMSNKNGSLKYSQLNNLNSGKRQSSRKPQKDIILKAASYSNFHTYANPTFSYLVKTMDNKNYTYQ